MFGDFDDLTPDEHQRVHHILHGYKEPSAKKVEVGFNIHRLSSSPKVPEKKKKHNFLGLSKILLKNHSKMAKFLIRP